ncbi:Acylaminoacyl-peptidase [Saliniradius amylolyticus]|uniref:Acylaminoacyl-peptidase n=1 Tax=Saliniradius amylolyticus TaxID=2183582 RepID=A0A2S2E074_9ALTE|nr:alpha/beta fold hydrolase [Saliniradius amylolyticus]AWL11055.1 Acylaminoacyl-peptidase [Saliniradius amylolyticus]
MRVLLFLCFSLTLPLQLQANTFKPEQLFDFSEYSGVKISPDGRHLAVRSLMDGKRGLIFINRARQAMTGYLKFSGNDEVGDYFWANNERVVIKLHRRPAWSDRPLYFGELYAVNLNGEDGEPIYGYRSGESSATAIKTKTSDFGWARIVSTLPEDPRHILITSQSARRNSNNKPLIQKLDIYRGITQGQPFRAPIPHPRIIINDDGELLAVGKDDNDITRAFVYLDNEWQPLESSGHGQALRPVAGSKHGFLVLDDQKQDETGLFSLDTEHLTFSPVYSEPGIDITHAIVSNDDQHAYALRVDNGYPTYLILDSGHPEAKLFKQLLATFPGHKVSITSRTSDNQQFIVKISSDREAGQFYLFDNTSGSLNPIFSYYPNLSAQQLIPMTPFSAKARDGQTIAGYFLEGEGAGEQPLPTVVLVHGGPHSRDYWQFDPQAQYLALNGFNVLQVNFRGSTGYGRSFKEAGYGHWGTLIQDDIADAVNWAMDADMINDKICIMGASFGAYSAVQSSIRYPGMYDCVIANAGVYDLPLLFEEGDIPNLPYGEAYLRKTLGEDEVSLKAMSPVYHADKLNVPLFLAHGGQDQRAPIEQAERLTSALERAGKHYQLYTVDTEGHGFYDPNNQKQYMQQVIGFVRQHLSGSEEK